MTLHLGSLAKIKNDWLQRLDFGPISTYSQFVVKERKRRPMNWSALKGYCSRRRYVWLLLGMLWAALPLTAATDLIYVANRGGTTIDVIDAATNKVVQTIR